MLRRWPAVLALWLSIHSALADPAILQIRILEGEGIAYAAGTRATRGITIQVTDETGKPVDGASVSFRLPEEGPGGTFSSGSKTEVATSATDGRATVWGMQWNRTPGPLEVRITAVKGQARAGTVCSLYISEASPGAKAEDKNSRIGGDSSHKWLWITLAAVGVAGAGAAAAMGGGSGPAPSSAAGVSALRIGAPTITVGHP